MTPSTPLLPCIEVNPSAPAIGSVILLHGLGADGNDFVPLVPELHLPANLPLRFVFPNAPQQPVTINNGYVMPAWYDITSLDINQRNDKAGMTTSMQAVEKLIAHEESRGIPADKIVLAGFSQGAVIALLTGLNFPQRLAGILAMSGYLPDAHPAINLANQQTPIFMAHGKQDTVVPYTAGLTSYDVLQQQGLNISWHSYAMAHSVCEQETRDIASWLRKIYEAGS
jgi:phospholipase/carboxylesterase